MSRYDLFLLITVKYDMRIMYKTSNNCFPTLGYGLTESTASACVMDPYDMTYGRVGAPSSLIDLRLVSWEEGGYRITNKPYPQGEKGN